MPERGAGFSFLWRTHLDDFRRLSRLGRVSVLCDEDRLLCLDHEDAVRLQESRSHLGAGE